MKVFYRVSPFLSSHPNPLGNNKYEIIRACHTSFQKAKNEQDSITYVCDSLPPPWKELFNGEMVEAPHGNEQTFHHQLDLVSKLDDNEDVLICEDDYLWRPETLQHLINAIQELSIVFPYDHPGHHLEPRFQTPKMIKMVGNMTYREAPSNTLTFACKAKIIKENLGHFKSYGIRDHEMFSDLQIDKWAPCYSFATHMAEGLLAPNVDWQLLIEKHSLSDMV